VPGPERPGEHREYGNDAHAAGSASDYCLEREKPHERILAEIVLVFRFEQYLSMYLRMGNRQPCVCRSLFVAAGIHLSIAAGVASAQTAIVTNVPAGSKVEFVLNTSTVGAASAETSGTVTLSAPADAGLKAEMDAYIYVDSCDDLRRVVVVDRNQPLPADVPGCRRTQIAGVFLVRPVSTLVVNVEGPTPTVLLRQGRFTPRAPGPRRTWNPPTGLVLSGGAGLGSVSDPVVQACGDIPECSGDAAKLALTASAAFWFSPNLAVEVGYLKPWEVEADGTADTFRFNSAFNADVLTMTGKVGFPAGRVRIYGKAGGTYQQSTFTTTQITEDITTTTDGVTTTIEGGTQIYELRTGGWGWMFGGGLDVWLKSSFGLYAEGAWVSLKGNARDDADGATDDRVIYFVLGGRVRIGR
jgi:hypothetical protein